MGLDIFFKKVKHAQPFAEGTRQRIDELRDKWRNAYYGLPDEQFKLINAEATIKEDVAAEILTPIYMGIKNEVDMLLNKTKDDDLKAQVSIRMPNANEILDADACFVMGDYCQNEIAYFRKVNFLLPAFNYQDNCSDIEIAKCEVEDLLTSCDNVLALYNRHKAGELNETELADMISEDLPTTAGFFFGSTKYDEWYFKNVEYVRNEFTRILETLDWDNETLIMKCWW
jgi:hypothetical protein